MGQDSNKRKQGPGASHGGSAHKKSKGGSGGRWQTPHQKAKQAERVEMGTALSIGDEGIWVTYARGMKSKALREFRELCYEYGESLFDIKRPDADGDAGEEEDGGDIEASIKQELEGMKASQKPTARQVFTPVGTGLECVFFMKTMKPIDPIKLVSSICQDAKDCADPRQRKCKYVNRLTPVVDTDKASENGIDRVARSVMAPFLHLKDDSELEGQAQPKGEEDAAPACTFAIRHTIRNHTALKSDAVIKRVANLVQPRHKVNLTSPDKVVLVEIFQTNCGISVVDGKQWDELKRYNVNELYKLASEQKKEGGEEEKEAGAITEETPKSA